VDDSEISFGKGDRITNAEEVTYSRWIGTAPDGHRGMFPANQVKIGKDITNIQFIDLHWALNIVNIDYAGFEALSFKKLIIRNISISDKVVFNVYSSSMRLVCTILNHSFINLWTQF